MSRNKRLNMRHRVRQELDRASNNCEMLFEHLSRAVDIYEGAAPEHHQRAVLLCDILAALQQGIVQLHDDT